ncbi:MAG TPA: hypothetical protein VGG39_14565 [Polyangiaceae bacterium]|jgi:hypothetical protein
MPKAPIIDILIARDGDSWRIYSAPRSWRTPFSLSADARADIRRVGQPDLADLDRFMWEVDAPFERRPTAEGGIEIVAAGRSAVVLVIWLHDLIACGQPA